MYWWWSHLINMLMEYIIWHLIKIVCMNYWYYFSQKGNNGVQWVITDIRKGRDIDWLLMLLVPLFMLVSKLCISHLLFQYWTLSDKSEFNSILYWLVCCTATFAVVPISHSMPPPFPTPEPCRRTRILDIWYPPCLYNWATAKDRMTVPGWQAHLYS